MRLWTIQHPEVYNILQKRGVYHADGRRAVRWFRPAYRWMMEQMRSRLPDYSGRYPIWAWHTPKPDMRMSSYRSPADEPGVRLTLEIPDEEATSRMLLSGFDAWGCQVLNNWYLDLSDEEYEWWVDLAGRDRFNDKMPSHLQEMIYRSWERVFDLEALDRAAWLEDPEVYTPLRVQATFEEISLEDVVKVEHFRAIDPRA